MTLHFITKHPKKINKRYQIIYYIIIIFHLIIKKSLYFILQFYHQIKKN